jgi:predicted O-methyltransferase YrrM
MVDYLMLEALYEAPDFSLLVMGRTDTVGCYCPLNELLRGTIAAISSQYDVIIIDADLEYPPESIPAVIGALREHPVVYCSRFSWCAAAAHAARSTPR